MGLTRRSNSRGLNDIFARVGASILHAEPGAGCYLSDSTLTKTSPPARPSPALVLSRRSRNEKPSARPPRGRPPDDWGPLSAGANRRASDQDEPTRNRELRAARRPDHGRRVDQVPSSLRVAHRPPATMSFMRSGWPFTNSSATPGLLAKRRIVRLSCLEEPARPSPSHPLHSKSWSGCVPAKRGCPLRQITTICH